MRKTALFILSAFWKGINMGKIQIEKKIENGRKIITLSDGISSLTITPIKCNDGWFVFEHPPKYRPKPGEKISGRYFLKKKYALNWINEQIRKYKKMGYVP